MVRNLLMKKKQGFTLVELLIVVAIVGILSTLGIPTFRKMVQKSKKTEAKTNLGNLFTVEAAFFSEYGGYGNNLQAMGYEIDGKPAQMTYRFGFSSGSAWANPTNTIPSASSSVGTNINNVLPLYYNSTVANYNNFGRTTLNTSAGMGGLTNIDVMSTSPYNTYLAGAAGVVAPGIDRDNPSVSTDVDTWTIDEGRQLRNVQDGVK